MYRPNGESELYDVRKDPRELNNIFDADAPTPTQTQLELQLLRWFVLTSDVTPLKAPPPPAVLVSPAHPQEDPRGIPPPPPVPPPRGTR